MSLRKYNPKATAPALYIPCWLSQVSTQLVSNSAKILYGRLAQWCDENGDSYRSAPQLAVEIGTTVRSVERHLKELRDIGLIETYQPQAGGVNHFVFLEHEWMMEPLKKQLTYKSSEEDPPTRMSVPPDKNVGTPPTKVADININKIKTNKKDISTSCEVHISKLVELNVEENQKKMNDAKTGYGDYQTLCSKKAKKVLDESDIYAKSDNHVYQTLKYPLSSKKDQYNVNNILADNIFQIPKQIIFDWVTNRKKKRAAITQTAWDKINKELAKCKEAGIDPVEAFETMVASGWQSLRVSYFENKNTPKPQAVYDDKDSSWFEGVLA